MFSIKRLLCTGAAMIGLCAGAANAQIVQFNVNNENGICATATTILDFNVSSPELCRGLGLSWTSAANGFNSSGWTAVDEAGAIANNDYVSATFIVNGGFNANIDVITANLQRSSTGPQNMSVRSSVDGFATSLAVVNDIATSASLRTFDIPDIIGATGVIELRFYAWGATSEGGTCRFQDNTSNSSLTINGTVQTGSGGDPQGACCLVDAPYCSFVTQAVCASLGGTYQGDNVTCGTANCPIPTGACCIDGFCGPGFTESQCTGSGGQWFGENSVCDFIVCDQPTGRCCLPDDSCVEMITEADCSAQGGSNWLQDGFCDSFICVPNVGACCLTDLSCIITDGPGCDALGGAFMGRGTVCESVNCTPASGGNLVAKYDFDVNRVGVGNNLTFTFSPMPPFSSAGDGFGPLQRFYTASEPPFTLLDDSLSIFEPDSIGIVDETKRDAWFGINDLLNNDNLSGAGTAEWTFNIAGRTNLSISIDLAAMGDFEAAGTTPDEYDFSVSIDGGTPQVVFSLRADEALEQTYTLAGGAMFTLPDPLVVYNSTILSNIFQTLTASIAGTGSVLTLTLTCTNDSDEGVVFDNIMIMGDAGGPATGACCLLNGSCAIQTEADCLAAGGIYQGNGAACNQATCDALNVACCISNTCQVLPLGACLFQSGTADAFSASCDGASCGPAFCDADWCQDGEKSVSDIFCFLADWFALDNDARTYGGASTPVQAIFAWLAVWFATPNGACVP